MKPWLYIPVIFIICLSLVGCHTDKDQPLLGDIYTDTSSGTLSFSIKNPPSNSSEKAKNNNSNSKNTKLSSTKNSSVKEKTKKFINIRNNNRAYFHTVGRCIPSSGTGLRLSWGGSSISFDLLCENEISISFSISAPPEQAFRCVFLRITVDGKQISNSPTKISESTILPIATNLKYGTHRITITRLTDGDAPPVIFEEIQTYGDLVKTTPKGKKYLIEAIGDDAILGRGILSNDVNLSPSNSINSNLQDVTKTYPYLAATALNADCYILARSGAGFSTGYLQISEQVNGKYKQITDPMDIIPNIYPLTDLYTKDAYTVTRSPDIILLDMGRADIQNALLKAVNPNGISAGEAVNRATEFLKQLKQSNPESKIICCYGLILQSEKLEIFLKTITRNAGGKTAGIYMVPLETASHSGLPTINDHKKAATSLLKVLHQVL